jgi:hypothetical protein
MASSGRFPGRIFIQSICGVGLNSVTLSIDCSLIEERSAQEAITLDVGECFFLFVCRWHPRTLRRLS